jgi:hypothetical protein
VARLITLKAKDLPPTWHVSNSGSLASSYGPGSVLATPAIVHAWAAAHPGVLRSRPGRSPPPRTPTAGPGRWRTSWRCARTPPRRAPGWPG